MHRRREVVLLEPSRMMETVDAVVLCGGSAFGLAAADGVMRFLSERGRGYPTAAGPVPIVPAAAVYDLVESGGRAPTADDGYAAAVEAERGGGLVSGRIGAGAGATVGKWRGPEHRVAGGQGTASLRDDGAIVGALAVVNAIGDVIGTDGGVLAGSLAPLDAATFVAPDAGGQTTLVVVATDARLTKAECHLLAQSAHLGIARAVHPSHTRFDGDLTVVLATGRRDAHLDRLRLAVVDVVATAIRRAVSAPRP